MFDNQRKNLYEKKDASLKDVDVRANIEAEHLTFSGNGSLKLSTSGNPFVDDFMSVAFYRSPRDIKDVFTTMSNLWSASPIDCLKETVYLRLITRDTKLFEGTKLKTQRGQGLKAEFFSRLMWIAVTHPDTFKKNLPLFIAAGSWDDVFELMRIDLSYEHDGNKYKRALDWKFLGNFILNSLNDEGQCNLIKKYLPQIKAAKYCTTKRSQCNNYIAKFIARLLFTEKGKEFDKNEVYKKYREFKASGTAHKWQQLISQERYNEINFDEIHGRALSILSNSKFLANHGLEESFYEWVLSKPTAKFTGFVYELFNKRAAKEYQKELINRQFKTLIDTAKENMDTNSRLICCIDTSGSMSSSCYGLPNSTSYNVAKAMALYFSELLEGQFANSYLEFASDVQVGKWEGETPYDKFWSNPRNGWGSTNFLGVATLFKNMRRMGIDESQFPTGVICISDGEFNSYSNQFQTIFKQFKTELSGDFSEEFVKNFKIVLWDIPNTFYSRKPEPKFESLADEENFYYISGFDPAGIAFLTGKTPKTEEAPKNAEELFQAAMNQELLSMLRI